MYVQYICCMCMYASIEVYACTKTHKYNKIFLFTLMYVCKYVCMYAT